MKETLLKKLASNLLNNNFKKVVVLIALLGFVSLNTIQAQVVDTYIVNQLQYGTAGVPAAFANVPFPAGGANKTALSVVAGNEDDNIYSVALPFAFSFGGTNFPAASVLKVSTNGFLTFGATAPTAGNYNPISSTEGYGGAISPYGRDLDVTGASGTINISHFTLGAVGSRIFKVEWVVKRSTGVSTPSVVGPGDTSNMIFQVWLYETTNVIEMHYNTATFNTTAALTGQIGLRGASNANFKNLSYTNPALPWPTSPAIMAESVLINTNSAVTKGTIAASNACLIGTSNRVFRWTPVTCFAPSGLAVPPISITSTTATLNWTAASPDPTLGYDYYVTTSNVAPTVATVPTGSVGFGIYTTSLTGLTSGTLQYVYVRSKCSGSDTSAWSPVLNFSTYCTPVTPYYYRDFSGPAIPTLLPGTNAPWHAPTLPVCTSQQNIGLGNPWVVTNGTYPNYSNSGMTDEILMYNGQLPSNGNPANVWFFTEGINLDATKTYAIDYLYGGTTTPATAINKMMVAYGTSPLATSMTTVLDDHPNIKASPIYNAVVFTPPTTGVYYFGLKAYSAPSNGQMYVDDLQVYEFVCKKPTNVSVSSITGTTAQLSWLPPTPAPTGGYVYYVSTTNVAPVNSTIPTGSTSANNVVLTGLNGSTNYYFWVRSNCGFGFFGEWVALVNGANSYFTTLVQLNYCASTSTTNQNYFTNVTSTNAITNIANSTGYSVTGYGDYTNQIITQAIGGTVSLNTTYNSMVGGVGIAVWVDWNQDGIFTDATERMYNSAAFLTTPPTINFTVPAALLGITRMRVVVDWNATSPNQCGAITRGETEDYAFQVVTPPPALVIDNLDDTVCASSPSNGIVITTGLATYNTFAWSPSIGVTGTGTVGDPYIITSNTTQVYTLTATQTAAPFRFNTAKFTYNATPIPTPIIISPASPVASCQSGPAVLLSATGGIVSGVTVLSENFNGATNSFTTVNSSIGGPVANAAWTLLPSGHNPFGAAVISNDASQHYFSDSDSQGSGNTTDVYLTSPAFSLVGFTDASLSFYHYYRAWIVGNATVQVSTNGTLWTNLQNYGPNVSEGTPTNFSNVIINLNSYVGQATVQIRFKYTVVFGWGWAIDNFLVSGSTGSAITWSPTTGLYTNALATTAYTGGATNAVYAMPNATQIYTASASSPSPVCTTTTNVTVNVTPILGGTASANQNICYGAPANLTLTGSSGTIARWEYATNLAFTTPVTIPLSNSATLTSLQMGALTANRYYRAVITNGACIAYSNVVSITINSTTWDGSTWSNGAPNNSKLAIFDDVYSPSTDPTLVGTVLNACSILVTATGDVSVDSGYTFNVLNSVTVDDVGGGFLTFQNSSSLVQVNNVVNSGKITYFRTTTLMQRFDYTYYSSPVDPQTLFAVSPLTLFDKYFTFNTVINNWQNLPSNTIMDKGRGYAIRAGQNFTTTLMTYTAPFFGVPNNGNIGISFSIGAGDVVLLGNPYPSALNADTFMLANCPTILGGNPAGNLDPNMYFWTHNTPITANNYTGSDYAIYNYAGGIGTTGVPGTANSTMPSGKVAAGQGFFMKALSNGSANYTNAMRLNGNNTLFYRNANSVETETNALNLERNRIWIDMFNNEGIFKQAMVGYVDYATNGLDLGLDGEVFEAQNPISLYSTVNNVHLGIQSRPLPFNENDIVPLGYRSDIVSTYEIKLSNFDDFFNNQNVYLEDYLLNVTHDLKASNYSFTTNEGVYNDRFALKFTQSSLTNPTAIFNEQTVVAVKNNQGISVLSSNTLLESITVFDVRGRELFTKNNINANQFTIANLVAAQQVLILKIKSVDGKVVDKKIIF